MPGETNPLHHLTAALALLDVGTNPAVRRHIAAALRALGSPLLLDAEGVADTLTAAKDRLMAGAKKGATCPCCGQFCKVYNRTLSATMALWLMALAKAHDAAGPGSWIHVRDLGVVQNGDYGRLPQWGMSIHASSSDVTKKCSGLWQITERGRAWVDGQIEVPRRLVVWNNEVVAHSDETVDIVAALGETHDYRVLMAASTLPRDIIARIRSMRVKGITT